MKKKRIVIIIVAAVILLASFGIYGGVAGLFQPGIKACPDHWYDNQMPTSGPSTATTQYLSIDGKRQEIKDYNLTWIKANCEVNEPSPVY